MGHRRSNSHRPRAQLKGTHPTAPGEIPGIGAVGRETTTGHRPVFKQFSPDIKRQGLDSVAADQYSSSMSEARDLVTDQSVDAVDLAWLDAAPGRLRRAS